LTEPTLKRTALGRGWRKRCPRCGQGRLFERWTVLCDQCDECDLTFEPSPGATWAFWVVGDRVFVVAAILPIYFGLAMASPGLRAALFALVIVSFFLTMPNRQGLAVALDYLTRVHWGDPVDTENPAPNSKSSPD